MPAGLLEALKAFSTPRQLRVPCWKHGLRQVVGDWDDSGCRGEPGCALPNAYEQSPSVSRQGFWRDAHAPQERRKRCKAAEFQKACAERHEEMRKAGAFASGCMSRGSVWKDVTVDLAPRFSLLAGGFLVLSPLKLTESAVGLTLRDPPKGLPTQAPCQVYESAMLQDSEQSFLAAIRLSLAL